MAITINQDTTEFVFSRICDATTGAVEMKLYGTVNGTADQQIDTTTAFTWTSPTGGSTTTDVVFTVPQPTTTIVVEYIELWNSGATEKFASLDFGAQTYTYNNNGTFTVSSIDLSLT